MKDRQIQAKATQPGIPIISPALHWLAMPAIVFLRSKFGYLFLAPKSIFLAFCWASLLFFIYAWATEGVWHRNWAVAAFFLLASILYVIHLAAAVSREMKKTAKHDFYSGTSHLLRIPGFSRERTNSGFRTAIHLWVEPAVVFVAATALRGFLAEKQLSTWLLVVAAALWFKEFINYWYSIRSEKKHSDIIEDAEERMPSTSAKETELPRAGGRKPRSTRINRPADPAPTSEEQFHAEILRLMPPRPPYDLGQAERNYKDLIKAHHPDSNDPTPGNSEKTAQLHEAIAYFRAKLGN